MRGRRHVPVAPRRWIVVWTAIGRRRQREVRVGLTTTDRAAGEAEIARLKIAGCADAHFLLEAGSRPPARGHR